MVGRVFALFAWGLAIVGVALIALSFLAPLLIETFYARTEAVAAAPVAFGPPAVRGGGAGQGGVPLAPTATPAARTPSPVTSPSAATPGGVTLAPTATPLPASQPTATAPSGPPDPPATAATATPSLALTQAWPRSMGISNSELITVTLFRSVPFLQTPTPGGGVALAVSTPIQVAVGTPNVPLEAAFQPEYDEVYAAARIAATNFVTATGTLAEQRLDQPQVVWVWNITPKSADQQHVNVTVDLVWRKKGDASRRLQYQLASDSLDINVTTPLFSLGQLNVIEIAGKWVGATFTLPVLAGFVAACWHGGVGGFLGGCWQRVWRRRPWFHAPEAERELARDD